MIRYAFSFFVFFLSALPFQAASSLLGIRLGEQSNYTRIVFDFEEKVPIKTDESSLLKITFSATKSDAFKQNQKVGLIKQVHTHSLPSGQLETCFKSPYFLKILKAFWIPPSPEISHYRYVIDVTKGTPKSAVPVLSPPLPSKIKTIVIDAGHGGQDPGALGYRETQEKNITLAVAKKLAKHLNESGHYKAILLREDDRFMSLGSRRKKAHTLKGDVFVSLHADSHPRSDTRGLGVYTLSSVASDKEAERLAQKENKADLIMGIDLKDELPEVSNILIDLTKRETMNLSIKLAQHLVSKLGRYVFLLRNPHRFAAFGVLKSTDIPSILIELGYLSNKKDEELLMSDSYQEKICNGILEGIEAYFHRKNF
jgi:N-acetylmuramoyl-L-alanine amidase